MKIFCDIHGGKKPLPGGEKFFAGYDEFYEPEVVEDVPKRLCLVVAVEDPNSDPPKLDPPNTDEPCEDGVNEKPDELVVVAVWAAAEVAAIENGDTVVVTTVVAVPLLEFANKKPDEDVVTMGAALVFPSPTPPKENENPVPDCGLDVAWLPKKEGVDEGVLDIGAAAAIEALVGLAVL